MMVGREREEKPGENARVTEESPFVIQLPWRSRTQLLRRPSHAYAPRHARGRTSPGLRLPHLAGGAVSGARAPPRPRPYTAGGGAPSRRGFPRVPPSGCGQCKHRLCCRGHGILAESRPRACSDHGRRQARVQAGQTSTEAPRRPQWRTRGQIGSRGGKNNTTARARRTKTSIRVWVASISVLARIRSDANVYVLVC